MFNELEALLRLETLLREVISGSGSENDKAHARDAMSTLQQLIELEMGRSKCETSTVDDPAKDIDLIVCSQCFKELDPQNTDGYERITVEGPQYTGHMGEPVAEPPATVDALTSADDATASPAEPVAAPVTAQD